MMKRRKLLIVLGASVLGAPLASFSQQPAKVPRVGWLVTGSPTTYRFSLAAFRAGLEALGYKEGQNIVIEYRWAEGHTDRLPELAAELVQQKVDVILAGGTIGARAAMGATREIPIVAAGVGDLVEAGIVTNYARPEGNLTGFVASAAELAGKRLEIMKEILPRARNIAVLWNPASKGTETQWTSAQKAATALQLTLVLYAARTLEELESVLVSIPRAHPDFLSVINDPFVFTFRTKITDAAAQAKLPAIYGFREFVDDGGLMSYGPSIIDTYRRAATYVDRILKGAKPAELPVQLPITFELVINMKTAKALGIKFPNSILLRADKVIE